MAHAHSPISSVLIPITSILLILIPNNPPTTHFSPSFTIQATTREEIRRTRTYITTASTPALYGCDSTDRHLELQSNGAAAQHPDQQFCAIAVVDIFSRYH
ncbi:hypothetical protein N7481_008735 [Penicillium waksmanii]|uniref:uncharacterized protein n=1 Tax=Penicillium waksmanii TaxID=69791 RepID=UPI002549A4A3|nr:uncharacterized protein N7481_008735 [Penicillium waksmanii]KAJ5975028.1 hypothetical protein N7481_008735 [Penicillium waksmanii]